MRLRQVIPKMPPEIDGVGDFALALGREIEERFGIGSEFVSARQLGTLRGSGDDILLLHYSGYGYDRRGIPAWLPGELAKLDGMAGRTAVFFHELWVESRPWRTPFYFAPAQKRIVRQLHGLASASFTSTPKMKRQLEQGGGRATLAPVPSTVPAATAPPKKDGPEFTAVVFGQAHTRARSVAAHRGLLGHLHRTGRFASLKLAGKAAGPGSPDYRLAARILPRERIETRGDLAPPEIARELASADFALSFYPPDYLTKSTTIMAAFANGCPVILSSARAGEPFDPPPPVLFAGGSAEARERILDRGILENTAAAARAWYSGHASWGRMTETIARELGLGAPRTAAAGG